ncbi:MAG: hypothetical protein WBA22_02125 [Candidatus Methanofastidiosia archaeon]
MDLMKIGQARDLLMKSEKAKKALIDAFGQGTVTNDTCASLQLIVDTVVFCECDEMELLLVESVISSLSKEMRPPTEDVMKILDILSECQHDLKDYIVEKMYLSEPKSEEFYNYYDALSSFVGKREKTER